MKKIMGLLESNVGGLSLGRFSFLILLAPALWAWGHGRDVPDGHLITLLTCFGYLMGGKLCGSIKTRSITMGKEDKP